VTDQRFLERVERGDESFRKGDMLRVRLARRQSSDSEGLHSEFEVLDVFEHIPRPTQLKLPGTEDSGASGIRDLPPPVDPEDPSGPSSGPEDPGAPS
jgi:hypothetical protein